MKLDNYITGKVNRTTLDDLTKDLVGKWKTLYTEGFLPKAIPDNTKRSHVILDWAMAIFPKQNT